jgi:hypothetical protein
MLTPSPDQTELIIAALAASAPLLVDTLLNTRVLEGGFYDLELKNDVPGAREWSILNVAGSRVLGTLRYMVMHPLCVGADALAGYTFARVARNQGEDLPIIHPFLLFPPRTTGAVRED